MLVRALGLLKGLLKVLCAVFDESILEGLICCDIVGENESENDDDERDNFDSHRMKVRSERIDSIVIRRAISSG